MTVTVWLIFPARLAVNSLPICFTSVLIFVSLLSLSCVVKVRFEAPVPLTSNEANQPNPAMMMSSEMRPPRRPGCGPPPPPPSPFLSPVPHDSSGGLTRLANSTVQILPQASCSLKTQTTWLLFHTFKKKKKIRKKNCTESNLPDVLLANFEGGLCFYSGVQTKTGVRPFKLECFSNQAPTETTQS